MNTTLAQRKLVRSLVGASATQPVIVVEGNAKPHWHGRSYYWTTLSGKTEVRFPNAYKWPCTYHASTLELRVGEDWLSGVVNLISLVAGGDTHEQVV